MSCYADVEHFLSAHSEDQRGVPLRKGTGFVNDQQLAGCKIIGSFF